MIKTPNSVYRGRRFPAEVIPHAVWLYFRFPLSLRMVQDLLAARGIIVSHETVRRLAEKFGREFALKIRQRFSQFGDKWHLDEVVFTIDGKKHWLWRAVDQEGFVLDALVQNRRDKRASRSPPDSQNLGTRLRRSSQYLPSRAPRQLRVNLPHLTLF